MLQTYYECQPWHLEREGADEALSRMAGEIGVDGVQLQVAGSGLAAFYPRGPQGPHIDSCEAGLQFQLDSSKYSGVRVRPRVASWIKSRNPLDAVCKLAERHRLRLRASLPDVITMPDRSTFATIINALGDVGPYVHCVAHPDTHELLGALIEDLSTNYPIEVVEMAAPQGPSALKSFELSTIPTPVRAGGALDELLGWCFCPACRQQAQSAGIDTGRAQEKVTTSILESLDPESEHSDDQVLHAYFNMHPMMSRQLVRNLRERCKSTLSLRADPSNKPIDASKLVLSTWMEHCDRITLHSNRIADKVQVSNIQAIGAAIASERSLAGQAAAALKVDLMLPCRPPEVVEGSHMVSLAHEVSHTTVEAIIFRDYATAPNACLDWVRQAIRYARRESK